jgi:hypothetical protein
VSLPPPAHSHNLETLPLCGTPLLHFRSVKRMEIGVFLLLLLLVLPTERGECANAEACRMIVAGLEHQGA